MYSVDDIIENLDHESNLDENDLEGDIELIEEGGAQPQSDAAEGDENNENETTKPAKKTRAKSERPKLDAQRLRGPRGLTALDKMYANVKFKGNGQEKEDLDKVMVILHHWCHRLFPKYTFDDTLAHLEKLGAKKSVLTLKNSIRMGLMDEPENEVEIIEEPMEAMNEFDALLEQEVHAPLNIIRKDPSPVKYTLTEEQKDMIAKNRLLAAERRRAKLEAQQQENSQNTHMSTKLSQEVETTLNVSPNEPNQNFESSNKSSQIVDNNINALEPSQIARELRPFSQEVENTLSVDQNERNKNSETSISSSQVVNVNIYENEPGESSPKLRNFLPEVESTLNVTQNEPNKNLNTFMNSSQNNSLIEDESILNSQDSRHSTLTVENISVKGISSNDVTMEMKKCLPSEK